MAGYTLWFKDYNMKLFHNYNHNGTCIRQRGRKSYEKTICIVIKPKYTISVLTSMACLVG